MPSVAPSAPQVNTVAAPTTTTAAAIPIPVSSAPKNPDFFFSNLNLYLLKKPSDT
jgi:hypothetical protein